MAKGRPPPPETLKNLRPPFKKGEVREEQRRGGIASGKTRRGLKTFKELLTEALREEDPETGKSKKEAVIEKWLEITMTGTEHAKLKAIEMVRDTIGEKPVEKQEITGNLQPPVFNIVGVTPEDEKK